MRLSDRDIVIAVGFVALVVGLMNLVNNPPQASAAPVPCAFDAVYEEYMERMLVAEARNDEELQRVLEENVLALPRTLERGHWRLQDVAAEWTEEAQHAEYADHGSGAVCKLRPNNPTRWGTE